MDWYNRQYTGKLFQALRACLHEPISTQRKKQKGVWRYFTPPGGRSTPSRRPARSHLTNPFLRHDLSYGFIVRAAPQTSKRFVFNELTPPGGLRDIYFLYQTMVCSRLIWTIAILKGSFFLSAHMLFSQFWSGQLNQTNAFSTFLADNLVKPLLFQHFWRTT